LKGFQSAPAIDGGRSSYQSARKINSYSFQSAPAIDGGRSTVLSRRLPELRDVSIRARHRWRAIPIK